MFGASGCALFIKYTLLDAARRRTSSKRLLHMPAHFSTTYLLILFIYTYTKRFKKRNNEFALACVRPVPVNESRLMYVLLLRKANDAFHVGGTQHTEAEATTVDNN